MGTPSEDLLRRIGWRLEHERWWDAFDALWNVIGCTESVRHNLLVMVHSESHETSRAAAFEVAAAVMATAAVLRGVML